ncbi:MAG TPA: hypothetical protein VF412_03275 [Bdellovibrio sp.]|uniref:hypothetical protein n=1 Tax=Bdellovibrio sp. TaxID=28201 RepID=UPI002F148650
MKAVLLIVALFVQFGVQTSAQANQVYRCSAGSEIAFLSLQEQSIFTGTTDNECNAGPGDDPTDCHPVEYKYEVKQALVLWQNQSAEQSQRIELRRFQGAESLFSGSTSVTLNSRDQIQIFVEPSDINSQSYSIKIVKFHNVGTEFDNAGVTKFFCQSL